MMKQWKSIGIVVGIALLIILAFFTTAFPMEPRYSFISALTVVLFALPSYIGVIQSIGIKRGFLLIFSMCIFALVLENIAVITGFPYGNFSYNLFIGQRIGVVPWTVGFAWTPILFGAISLARKYLVPMSYLLILGATALLMTLFDFVLDPASVSLGFWEWEQSTGFYGVPWSNFIGWLFSSTIAVHVAYLFLKMKLRRDDTLSPLMHSSLIAMLIYWTAVCMFERLWLPGLIGCGLLLIFRILHQKRN